LELLHGDERSEARGQWSCLLSDILYDFVMREGVFASHAKSFRPANTHERGKVFEFDDLYGRAGNTARTFVESVDPLGKAVNV
jgi:hypothetical protein